MSEAVLPGERSPGDLAAASESGAAGSTPAGSPAGAPRRSGCGWRWAMVLVLLLGLDWLQPPAHQLSNRAALLLIDLYQASLSPLMPGLGVRCRFTPTCSHYGEAALRCRGLPAGAGLAAWRILRCGPWTRLGTLDPPPCSPPDGAASGDPAAASSLPPR